MSLLVKIGLGLVRLKNIIQSPLLELIPLVRRLLVHGALAAFGAHQLILTPKLFRHLTLFLSSLMLQSLPMSKPSSEMDFLHEMAKHCCRNAWKIHFKELSLRNLTSAKTSFLALKIIREKAATLFESMRILNSSLFVIFGCLLSKG